MTRTRARNSRMSVKIARRNGNEDSASRLARICFGSIQSLNIDHDAEPYLRDVQAPSSTSPVLRMSSTADQAQRTARQHLKQWQVVVLNTMNGVSALRAVHFRSGSVDSGRRRSRMQCVPRVGPYLLTRL